MDEDSQKILKELNKLKEYIFKEIDKITELHVADDSIKIKFLKSIADEYKLRIAKIEKLGVKK